MQILPKVYHHSVASWTAPVKDRKSEGLSDSCRESKEGVRKTIKKIFDLNCRYFPKLLMVLIYWYYLYCQEIGYIMEDGGLDGTVVDCRQNHLGKFAGFPPFLTFSNFDS